MSKLKTIIFFLSIVTSLHLVAGEAPNGVHEFNVVCPAARLIPVLDTAYHECNNGFVKSDGSCPKFVEVFRQLLPEFDCQRTFDATPTQNFTVPAIWLAGDGAMEDYVRLLWRMSSSKDKMFRDELFRKPVYEAKVLFSSKEFRHILDGALAEEYVERSETIERLLNKTEKLVVPRLRNPE